MTACPQVAERSIHVVAGVIYDGRGRVLLARRTEGRDLAGLWEFPGGKVESGETPEHALGRELLEELGIDVDVGDRLICVPQRYPDKRLQLDVRTVTHWSGTLRGLEGQALAWVPPGRLARYAMPPADRPVVAALLQPSLYVVTPEPGDKDEPWLDALAQALARGGIRVQLRARSCTPVRWGRLAARAKERCEAAGVDVFINGDALLARELGIGLHLQAAQLHDPIHRSALTGLRLAASCHGVADLQAAQALGCEFAVVGSVDATPSHPGAPGIGWAGFRALREEASLPIYAIGGLGACDLHEARSHGAQGIAAIRALWPGSG